jgi:hypothetical protein
MTFLLAFVAVAQLLSPIEAGQWPVYLRRAGPARIGMTVNEVRRVLADPMAYLAYAQREPDDSDCAYLQSAAKPERLRFMFQQGRLVRIDVDEPLLRTKSGAGIGDTEEKIKRTYPGRITVEQHKYLNETGHYLNYRAVDANDRDYGMVFETEKGRVITFRVGTLAAIALVERCS